MTEIPQLKIIFMGTPEFAVEPLEALLKQGYNIIAVITAPDKPAGRGLKVIESAVKQAARKHGLKILQPVKFKDEIFLEELRGLNADLQIVVAFRMLPEVVWNMPCMGTINLHASLLPQYRGAAPINWAIINGEKETGVTTFKLKHEIDTGDILLKDTVSIADHETAGQLHDKLKTAGSALLVRTVDGISQGVLKEYVQPEEDHASSVLKHAPKIFTDTCKIDWSKSIEQIYDLIRGLSPYPAAFTTINGKTLKIFKAIKESADIKGQEPEFTTDHKSFLKFTASNGYISILECQLEGKKRMGIEEFLRGWRI